MVNPSYSDGTISVVNGSAAVAGVGTAWSTQAKPGDVVVHMPTAAAPQIVGFIASVDSDLALTLLDAWQGAAIAGEDYRIVRGYAWWTGAAPNETLVQFLTELGPLGLAGATNGPPTPSSGRENQINVDYLNDVVYQRRGGAWHVVATGFAFSKYGLDANLSNFDDEAEGFTYFATDQIGFYVKLSATSADWSALISLAPPSVQDVLDALGINSITISENDPSGGADGDLWFKVSP